MASSPYEEANAEANANAPSPAVVEAVVEGMWVKAEEEVESGDDKNDCGGGGQATERPAEKELELEEEEEELELEEDDDEEEAAAVDVDKAMNSPASSSSLVCEAPSRLDSSMAHGKDERPAPLAATATADPPAPTAAS